MTISNNVKSKLLVAVLALATVSTFTLDAMKRKQSSISTSSDNSYHEAQQPVDPRYKYLLIKAVSQKCVGDEVIFPVELVQYIYLFNRQSIQDDHVEDIIKNFDNASKPLDAIDLVCKTYTPDESVEIVRRALNKIGLNETACVNLLDKAFQSSKNIFTVFLAAADKINQEWAKKKRCHYDSLNKNHAKLDRRCISF